jgi:hypothetical protein
MVPAAAHAPLPVSSIIGLPPRLLDPFFDIKQLAPPLYFDVALDATSLCQVEIPARFKRPIRQGAAVDSKRPRRPVLWGRNVGYSQVPTAENQPHADRLIRFRTQTYNWQRSQELRGNYFTLCRKIATHGSGRLR